MSYQEFGLDVVKKATDPGHQSATFYDPWTWQHVTGRSFYLCFSNWVVSKPTIEAFSNQEPVEPLDGDQCIKCKTRNVLLHYQIATKQDQGTPIGICSECIRWAAEYLEKEPPIKAGTQFNLF